MVDPKEIQAAKNICLSPSNYSVDSLERSAKILAQALREAEAKLDRLCNAMSVPKDLMDGWGAAIARAEKAEAELKEWRASAKSGWARVKEAEAELAKAREGCSNEKDRAAYFESRYKATLEDCARKDEALRLMRGVCDSRPTPVALGSWDWEHLSDQCSKALSEVARCA